MFDFVARQKLGGTSLKFFTMRQLTVPSPGALTALAAEGIDWANWNSTRVIALCFTSRDLAPFAHDCGFDGPPFPYDPERRFHLRCELDAAFFHLYCISKEDAAYILDTFPIVRRNDEARYGRYRTKETILELWDRLPPT